MPFTSLSLSQASNTTVSVFPIHIKTTFHHIFLCDSWIPVGWRGNRYVINTFFKKSLPFLCLNPMGLNFKEEESIINTSEVSKKAWHLWLWEVEKLMTTISGLWRDRRLFSWDINNLALFLCKPVCNFRDGTALPEHVRSASCLDQRRLRHSVRELLDGEKKGNQFQGWW